MIKAYSADIDGKTISVEVGRVARQASGSAVVTLGETVVLVTVVSTDQVDVRWHMAALVSSFMVEAGCMSSVGSRS